MFSLSLDKNILQAYSSQKLREKYRKYETNWIITYLNIRNIQFLLGEKNIIGFHLNGTR